MNRLASREHLVGGLVGAGALLLLLLPFGGVAGPWMGSGTGYGHMAAYGYDHMGTYGWGMMGGGYAAMGLWILVALALVGALVWFLLQRPNRPATSGDTSPEP